MAKNLIFFFQVLNARHKFFVYKIAQTEGEANLASFVFPLVLSNPAPYTFCKLNFEGFFTIPRTCTMIVHRWRG